MATNSVSSGGFKLPTALFNVSTFGTLGGCASVTWLVANVLSGIVNLAPNIVGFAVSIIVAYVAAFLSGGINKKRYVVAFFNGFLIYFIVVGATALTPLINPETANAITEDSPSIVDNLTRPWFPDTNMVERNEVLEDDNNILSDKIDKQELALDDINKTLMELDPSTSISTFEYKLSRQTLNILNLQDVKTRER